MNPAIDEWISLKYNFNIIAINNYLPCETDETQCEIKYNGHCCRNAF